MTKIKSSSMPGVPNRNVILGVGSIAGTGCGAIYMWSIFNKPLMELFGFTTAEVSMAYSLFLLFSCFSGWLAGWLQKRVQLRYIVLGAGVLFGLGWLLSGFADSLGLLYLFFGVFAGSGNGMLYNTIVAVVVKWFPDKRGFANGLCIGVLGLGPLLFAPAGNWLIESFGVQTAFRIVGVVWLVVYLTMSWVLKTPPEGWAPKRGGPRANVDEGTPKRLRGKRPRPEVNLTTREMFRQPLYYCLFVLYLAASMSGLMVTGHASNIGQDMAGLTASQGALMVGSMAVGNFCGRFGFSFLSDYLGRFNTLIIVLALNTAVMLLMMPQAHDFVVFLIAVSLVGACFGATVSLVPTITSDAFGSKNFGMNYSFVYPGYTVAAFVGPLVAALMFESSGSYVSAFVAAGVISLAGIAIVLACKMLANR